MTLQFHRRSLTHNGLLTLIGFVLLITGSLLASGTTARIGKLPKDSVANHKLHSLDGKEFTLAQLHGKVVVLDFFAVWCGHSKQHIPTMTKLNQTSEGRDLQIIGLAAKDAETTPERVKKFIEEMKITYPVGMIADPEFAGYVESKDVSVPQTLVYGKDGRLVAHFNGHNDATTTELNATVKRELEK